MSFPPGFLFSPSGSLALRSCPSFGSGVLLGPRPEELGRSSSGSAFAPYPGSGTSPGFNSHLPYGGEPRATSPGYDPSSGLPGSLDYHPFGVLGPYTYGDPSYRKNATRDATATLKAWLSEHRKNPYPTKGEKIMLAIITKMTLTQVSTWFANARRRLKKENKMTWTPRNRSEDEEDEDNIDLENHDEDDQPLKTTGDSDTDFKDSVDSVDRRLSLVPGPTSTGTTPQNTPLVIDRVERPSSPPSKDHVDSCGATQGPNPALKPKLWSLAEIATSSDKSRGCRDSSRTPFPHSPALPRHLYYTSPLLPVYSGFGPLGPLHSSHLNGLHQTMLKRTAAAARDYSLTASLCVLKSAI
uniref:Iroquois homeobox 5 n=1 Tax=Cyclopterus lumpus TaxID=8103 RepID=A0A8C3GB97_CYCLU